MAMWISSRRFRVLEALDEFELHFLSNSVLLMFLKQKWLLMTTIQLGLGALMKILVNIC